MQDFYRVLCKVAYYPFARFLFGATEAETYVGQEVVIDGWFRRGLTPYVEMSELVGEDHRAHRTYSRWLQYFLSACAIIGGSLWLVAR
jgi:hypothetical protein